MNINLDKSLDMYSSVPLVLNSATVHSKEYVLIIELKKSEIHALFMFNHPHKIISNQITPKSIESELYFMNQVKIFVKTVGTR